ncbi:MAG: type 1 glutamine amidotransferase [Bacteroidota bacterium]
MNNKLKFLIIDAYPKPSRDQFDECGVTLAGILYSELLLRHLPDAEFDIIYSSDPNTKMPDQEGLKKYNAIIWPGCNLTVYHDHDERVTKMVKLAKNGFIVGLPQFGSCWAAQLAVYVAGGEVKPNPKGREMGVARKVFLTEEGKKHPMYEGKTVVFDGFISHDDMITKLPEGATSLASNDFTQIQAVEVKHENGVFWATQYHPEYNLHEVARLIIAREEKLTREGYFNNHKDMVEYVEQLETIYIDNSRKDLKWKLAIDNDLLSDEIRELEFVNWLNKMVIPNAKQR